MSSGLPIATLTAQLLTKKAWGDFVHDFDDPVRANVTVGVLNTVPIEVTSSIKKLYGQLSEKIIAASGKNSATAFQLFKPYFKSTIPPAIPPVVIPDKVLHENDITGLVGIPYAAIVAALKATTPAKLPPTKIAFSASGAIRNYEVSAATEKIAGKHQHMVSCLNRLTGRTEIVLMWDAGACEISEIGAPFDTSVLPGFDPNGKYDIYFINSKENLSDPAPKPTVDTLSTKNPNVNLYFLEEWDPTETTIYPAWPTSNEEFTATQGDQNTNLYSGYRLITKRGEGKTVSGTLFTKGGKQIEIADIKETSKVANAVTTAVLDMLLGKSPEEFMSPILLKRAGDWCQALTLLDRSRRYRIIPGKGNVQRGGGYEVDKPVTLANFEKNNAAIALITNDRVLLAFAIALGLHVLFTNVRNGINWLVLFQNTDSGRVDDEAAVLAKAEQTSAAIDADLTLLTSGIQGLAERISASLGGLRSSFDLTNLVSVREAMYRLTRLPSIADLQSAKVTLTSIRDAIKIRDPTTPLALGLGVLRSTNSRVDAAREIAVKLLTPTTLLYPDASSETATLVKLNTEWSNGNAIAPTSDLYIQYQTIIDKFAADAAKLPSGFSLSPLPDDSVLQGPLTALLATKGKPLLKSRASRSMPELTALGLLFRYYNIRFKLGAQSGGARPLVLTGGAALAADFETNFLIPRLRDSKTIVAYTEATAGVATQVVDRTQFTAKEDNYVQRIDGTYMTVVDGFLTMVFDYDATVALFSQAVFSRSYPTPVHGMLAAMTADNALAMPLIYVLIRGLLTSLDLIYTDLLGSQTLEYSNLDALKDLADSELSLKRIGTVVDTIHLKSPLTPNDLGAFLSAYDTVWIKDVNAVEETPDAILETLMSNAFSAGGMLFVGNRFKEQYGVAPESNPGEFALYLEDVGPQIAYDIRVARTISQLLTVRDILIDAFSTPFSFISSPSTLAEYSRTLQNLDALNPGPPGANAPYAALEKAITDSFLGKTSGAVAPPLPLLAPGTTGGFQAPPTLSTNDRTPDVTPPPGGRRGLYTRLRQRAGEGPSPGV